MGEVDAARSKKIADADMGNRVYSDRLSTRRHRIHDDPICSGVKGIIHTGAPVKEHIQDLRCGGVRVFRLHDRVAALHKIGPGILLDGLDGAVNKSKIFAVAPALFLVLINQKEAASQGFTIAHVADEADIPLGLSAAFFI